MVARCSLPPPLSGRSSSQERKRKGRRVDVVRVFAGSRAATTRLVLFQLRSFLAVGLHPTVQVVLACCKWAVAQEGIRGSKYWAGPISAQFSRIIMQYKKKKLGLK
jgi:hypothetical protein